MLNEELVRAGLAHARLDYRYSGPMKRRLAAAQAEARRAGRGIWSSSQSSVVSYQSASENGNNSNEEDLKTED
jgi:endonuclease YncB( thermonuclease family)